MHYVKGYTGCLCMQYYDLVKFIILANMNTLYDMVCDYTYFRLMLCVSSMLTKCAHLYDQSSEIMDLFSECICFCQKTILRVNDVKVVYFIRSLGKTNDALFLSYSFVLNSNNVFIAHLPIIYDADALATLASIKYDIKAHLLFLSV